MVKMWMGDYDFVQLGDAASSDMFQRAEISRTKVDGYRLVVGGTDERGTAVLDIPSDEIEWHSFLFTPRFAVIYSWVWYVARNISPFSQSRNSSLPVYAL